MTLPTRSRLRSSHERPLMVFQCRTRNTAHENPSRHDQRILEILGNDGTCGCRCLTACDRRLSRRHRRVTDRRAGLSRQSAWSPLRRRRPERSAHRGHPRERNNRGHRKAAKLDNRSRRQQTVRHPARPALSDRRLNPLRPHRRHGERMEKQINRCVARMLEHRSTPAQQRD